MISNIEEDNSFLKNQIYKNDDEINQDDNSDLINSISNIIRTIPYDFLVKDLNNIYNEVNKKRLTKNNDIVVNKDSINNSINKEYNNKIVKINHINQNINNNNINENINNSLDENIYDNEIYDINSIEKNINNYKTSTARTIIDGVVDKNSKSRNNLFINYEKKEKNDNNKESAPAFFIKPIKKKIHLKKVYKTPNNNKNKNNNLNEIKDILEKRKSKNSLASREEKSETEEEFEFCHII